VTYRQSTHMKIAGGLLAIIVSVLAVIGFARADVDERIDGKIIEHEAVFEAKQQEAIGTVRKDVAVLQGKVNDIKEDTQEIKEILRESNK
jgi:hypothetical protein